MNFLPAPDDHYEFPPPPRTRPGTNGQPGGMSGRAEWVRPYAVTAAVFALACAVNIASRWHDARAGAPLWRPVLGETSSIASALSFAWIAFAARDRVRGLAPARAFCVHVAAACAFSVLHCLGMWTLRRIVLTSAGVAYGWSMSAGQFFYEFRKDLLTYTVIALIYQAVRGLTPSRAESPAIVAAQAVQGQAAGPAGTYTIRDGAKLWRVATGEILAVLSAGNYVEFALADGRRIMTRGTLAGVGADLADAGFVRVHRSWIVNAARVRALAPDTSGDYTLSVDGGMTVPLSRRFPEALSRLRGLN